MKVQYASDLHLEFDENLDYIKNNPIKPVGDILILAGDIIPFSYMEHKKYKDFFKYISDNFQSTYWIPGNHEYYGYDMINKSGPFIENIKSNLFLLNNKNILIGDTNFIFSTLWSNINPNNQWVIERSMNDFSMIKYDKYKFSVQRFNFLHAESLMFINHAIDKNNKNVVVSHYVPTFYNYPPLYKGDVLNEAFATELFDMIEESNINHWIYGHHHSNILDFEIGKTILHTNQLGYLRNSELKTFNDSKYFEI